MVRKRGRGGKAYGGSKPSSGKNTPRKFAPAANRNARKHEAAAASFSLADEGRWASTHRSSAFTTNKELRYLKIEFVSAGYLVGTIPEKPRENVASESPESPTGASAMANMAIRSPSPTPSASSSGSEEIVFTGRFARSTAPSTNPTSSLPKEELPQAAPVTPSTQSNTVEKPVSERQIHTPQQPAVEQVRQPAVEKREQSTVEQTKQPAVEQAKSPALSDVTPSSTSEDENEDEDGVLGDVFTKRRGGKSIWMSTATPWESRSKPGIGWLPFEEKPDMEALLSSGGDPAAAAMDDYMQNIREEIEGLAGPAATSAFARRALHIDDDTDDWKFEEANIASDDESSASGSDDGDSDMSDDSEESDEGAEEEYDDARIARILQKQEELGLGSDDIVLFGGDEVFDDPSDEPGTSGCVDKPAKRRPLHGQGKGRSRRSEPSFPSASAMADALDLDPYGGFDVMDTERPSLRPKKKGRRGQAPPELSDSDLNEQLQASWEVDRAKKRLKKAEREELRKQGLLGRKGKAPDLSVKYQDGFDVNDIIEEVREFMFSDMQTLSLPPMEANRRAVIHQIVNKLGVNSKSRGSGAQRFTVLSKTVRTKEVEDSYFDALIKKKGFRARFQSSTHMRKTGPKGTKIGASYKDGEVVGASAPELGPENKGRALLEKMGWTKGTALGALDNKGILQPIAHTVKTGKAGLR